MQHSPDERTGPAAAPSATGLRPSHVYWLTFAVCALLMTFWAAASAPMSGPDEPAHVVKAAAVVRGELRGTSAPDAPGAATVEVPALYAYSMQVPGCFAFHSEAEASCIPRPPADLDATTTASTWVVRNNPLYYAVVGLPTLLPGDTLNFYLMRVVSALLCASVLAWGFRALAELERSRWLGLGLVAATTPMVLFLGGMVNSSSLEIAAAMSLWVSMLALLRSPDPKRLPVRMAGIAVLAVLLANSRGLSPLFVGVIALVAITVSPWRNTVDVLRDRRSWPWLGVVAAGFVASLAWIANAGTLDGGGSSEGTGISFLGALRLSIIKTQDWVVGMIGHFGWLDTALPAWVYLLLAVGIGVVVVAALLLARTRRDVLSIVAVAGLSLALPVLLQAWQAGSVGMIWQGRYSIALSVGVPLLAAFVARDGHTSPQLLPPRQVFVVAAGVVAVGQVVAFAVNLHRYVRGTEASWLFPSPTDWSPPFPALLLLAGYAVTWIAFVVLIDRVCVVRDRDAAPTGPVALDPAAAAPDRARAAR